MLFIAIFPLSYAIFSLLRGSSASSGMVLNLYSRAVGEQLHNYEEKLQHMEPSCAVRALRSHPAHASALTFLR